MQSLRMAWRNLWRNTRRTAITGAAITLNTGVLIATAGLMDGMLKGSLDNTTNVAVGEAQIHHPKYREERSFYDAIKAPQKILAGAKAKGIDAAPRSFGAGLASSGAKSAGALFWGVDVLAERRTFTLLDQVAEGRSLLNKPPVDGEGGPVREALIGRKLARSLKAKVGTELVAVVQAADGSMGNELLVVRGVLKSIADDIDRSGVILHHRDFDELFVAGGRVHQIALISHGKLGAEQVVVALSPLAGEAKVESWKKIAPAIAEWLKMSDASMAIFGLIFYLSAFFGVLNSMLMATFERTREFGVIKALGATPWRIVRDVSAEALLLGVVASMVGLLLGFAGTFYLARYGIDLSSFGNLSYAGIAFDPIWRATLEPRAMVAPAVVMVIVTLLATLYPAIKAARLRPVQAMTHV